jgi:uncharacterized protein with HEPN domain
MHIASVNILEAIAKIREKTTNDIAAFEADQMLQVWVVHYLQVIGEAARGLSQALWEVPWPQIIALRNILVHGYFGLNMNQVWTMTGKDLPELEEQVRSIHSQISI